MLPEYAIVLANFKEALEMCRKASQNSPQFADLARRIKLRVNNQQTVTNLEELLHKPVARIQRHVAVIQVRSQFSYVAHARTFITINK